MYYLKQFSDLTVEELYEILKIRVRVFVVEQNCPYQEVDEIDPMCLHLFKKENDIITSYCRLIPPGVQNEKPSIGRILVNPHYRKKSYGKALVTEAINTIIKKYQRTDIQIHAQVYLYKFYRAFGFYPLGEEYLEDGIPHIDMELRRR